MSSTALHKAQILAAVSTLYGDTTADETEQADALEEIAQVCTENAEVLREMARTPKGED